MTPLQAISADLFAGNMTDLQTASVEAILKECQIQGVTDKRQISYILATAYHECHNPKHPELRLTPMKEFGGEAYLRSKRYYPYYGRGFSQLTWDYNYKKEAKRMGLDLINNPDLMLDLNTAANSHVYCMRMGTYTGKKLSDYITPSKLDFVNARRIINGIDKAAQIAGYASRFAKSLT